MFLGFEARFRGPDACWVVTNVLILTFILTMTTVRKIPLSCDWLPVKSIAKAFGQVILPLTSISRAGLTTDER